MRMKQGEHVDLFLDLHSSMTSVGSFVEGKRFEDVFRMEKHLLLPKLLGKIAPDFHPENCVYANEPLRPGTPTRYSLPPAAPLLPDTRSPLLLSCWNRVLGSMLSDSANCYTLYTSVHAFLDKSAFGLRVLPYTEERCIPSLANPFSLLLFPRLPSIPLPQPLPLTRSLVP